MKKIIASFAVLSALSTTAFAEADGGFQVGLSAGALQGASAHVGYRFSGESYWDNILAVRAEYSTLRPFKSMIEGYELDIDDTKYNLSAKGNQTGILLDIYPFASTWLLGNIRLTGGYYFGDFEATINHTENLASGSTFEFDFDDHNYVITANNDVKAEVAAGLKTDVKGPYVGLGFDIGLFAGLKLFFDAGVVKIKNTKLVTDIDVNTSNIDFTVDGTTYTGTAAVDAQISNAINQIHASLNDDLEVITDQEFMPIVKLGILYRF